MDIKFLSVPELARRLGISRIAVFKKIKSGKIKAIRIGRNWAIDESQIDEYFIRKSKLKHLSKKKVNQRKEEKIENKISDISVFANSKTDIETMGWD